MAKAGWDDLRFLLAAHRAGSLLGAARSLRVNHTTVGRRLRALEASLSVRILDRTPDGLTLTPAGERIAAAAIAMEERWLGLEREVSGRDVRLEGVVRIATTETFAATFVVPEIVGAVRRKHPHIDLEIVSTAGAFDLPRRAADLAIRMTRPTQQGLLVRKLGELAFAPFASRAYLEDHPRIRADLRGQIVIGYDRESNPNPGSRWLEQTGATAHVRSDQILTIRAAAIEGLGIAVIPCFLASVPPKLERAGKVVAVHDLWMVLHADLARVARIRAVCDIVVAEVDRHRARLRGD